MNTLDRHQGLQRSRAHRASDDRDRGADPDPAGSDPRRLGVHRRHGRVIARAHGARVVEVDSAEFSFGRALNVGCDAASTDLLVFVSAHVYPIYDSYLDRLTAPFADEEVALTYGRQVGDHRTKYSESRVMFEVVPGKVDPAPGPPLLQQRQRGHPAQCLAGASL